MREENFVLVCPMSNSNRNRVLKEMSSGAIGMSVASALLNPLDVIKVRLQGNSPEYTRFRDVLVVSFKRNGILRGLFIPGLSATVIRDVLNGAFRVGLYKEIEQTLFPSDTHMPLIFKKLITGTLVGSLGAGLWSHTDLIKTRLQTQLNPGHPYRSTIHAYRCIYREGGLKMLYQGIGPNMLRASIITTFHVGSYDSSKKLLKKELAEGPLLWTMCGVMSAFVTTTAAAPIDLIRTRIMVSSIKMSGLSMARYVMKNEGFKGLFRGWLPSFFRLGPHFTLSWPLIELSRKYLFGLDSF